jgi:hypothetical protein
MERFRTVIIYLSLLILLIMILDYLGVEFPTNYDFVRP